MPRRSSSSAVPRDTTCRATAASASTALYRLEGLDRRDARDSTLEPLLDIDSYLDYMILNQHGGNNDWDYRNWFAIRNRTNLQTGFRFLCRDSEVLFEGVDDNVLKPSGSLYHRIDLHDGTLAPASTSWPAARCWYHKEPVTKGSGKRKRKVNKVNK